jgi:hypothetical protein
MVAVEIVRMSVTDPHHVVDGEIVLQLSVFVPDMDAVRHTHEVARCPVPGTALEKRFKLRVRVGMRVVLVTGTLDRSGRGR